MLLNKANFLLANAASKENSRYVINGIQIEPDCTVATDGHRLVAIGAVREISPDDFPRIEGQPAPLYDFAPFILPRQVALDIAKAIPQNQRIPALHCAAVAQVPNGKPDDRATIYVTDLDTHRVFHTRRQDGQFPNWRQIVPKPQDATSVICMDIDLLQSTLAQLKNAGVKNGVTIRIKDAESAIRIDGGIRETGQPVMAVIMPMRGDIESAPYDFSVPAKLPKPKIPCVNCVGSGLVMDAVTEDVEHCPVCKGTGAIQDRDPEPVAVQADPEIAAQDPTEPPDDSDVADGYVDLPQDDTDPDPEFEDEPVAEIAADADLTSVS